MTDNPIYTFLKQTSADLSKRWQEPEFRNQPTLSYTVQIPEYDITGNPPWAFANGVSDTRFGKLVFNNRAEGTFISAYDKDGKFKLRKCELGIPYLTPEGKISSFTPSFFWVNDAGIPEVFDVVTKVTLEDRIKAFWANAYFNYDAELKKTKYNYKLLVLEETSKAEGLRPSFHNIFMQFAKSVARRSVSQKLQVGTVITSKDSNIIYSFGYNGDERGGSNKPVPDENGQHEQTVHSEYNALIKLDFNTQQDKVLYVTHSPCLNCARAIINANIQLVLYGEIYKGTAGVDLLRQRGVRVIKYSV